MNNIPPASWFRAMNKLYARKNSDAIAIELSERSKLKEMLGEKLNLFILWAGNQRLNYEADLYCEVEDFINCRFDFNSLRLFHTNNKQWKFICTTVFKRDNYTCFYCNKQGGTLECDHIIPISKGGSSEYENLTTSCRRCNRQKKDKTVEQFNQWKSKN